jgi:hypothetical protein
MYCNRCESNHDIFGPCPGAKDPFTLLREWFQGERSFDHYLIMAGIVLIGVLLVLGCSTLLR